MENKKTLDFTFLKSKGREIEVKPRDLVTLPSPCEEKGLVNTLARCEQNKEVLKEVEEPPYEILEICTSSKTTYLLVKGKNGKTVEKPKGYFTV